MDKPYSRPGTFIQNTHSDQITIKETMVNRIESKRNAMGSNLIFQIHSEFQVINQW